MKVVFALGGMGEANMIVCSKEFEGRMDFEVRDHILKVARSCSLPVVDSHHPSLLKEKPKCHLMNSQDDLKSENVLDDVFTIFCFLSPNDQIPPKFKCDAVLDLSSLSSLGLKYLSVFLKGGVFDASQIFQNPISIERSIRDSSKRRDLKEELIIALKEHAKLLKIHFLDSFLPHSCAVLEELLMNGFWDAHPKNRNLDRSIPVLLSEREKLKVRFSFNEEVFLISVIDTSGGFDKKSFLNLFSLLFHWEKLEIKSENTMKLGNMVGAGVGLYSFLSKLGNIAVSVTPGIQTTVSVVVDIRRRFREFQADHQNLIYQISGKQ